MSIDSPIFQSDQLIKNLLARYAKGIDPEESFREVVERLSGLVYQSALRRSRQREVAEEVMQTVFLIMARKAKSLARHRSLLAWVHATTKFETIQVLRSQERRRKREEQSKPDIVIMDESTHQTEILEFLDQALDRLSRSERELVLMKYFEELSYDEICRKTGRSDSAEKMRLKRSLEKMAGWLQSKGVTLSLTGLGVLLSTEMSKAAAPAAVAKTCVAVKTMSVPLTKSLLNSLQLAHPAMIAGMTTVITLLAIAVPAVPMILEVRELEEERDAAEAKMSEGAGVLKRAKVRGVNEVVDSLLEVDPDGISMRQLVLDMAHAEFMRDPRRMFRVKRVLAQMDPEQLKEVGLAIDQSPLSLNLQVNARGVLVDFLPADWSFADRIEFLVSVRSYHRQLGYVFGAWLDENESEAIAWLRKVSGTKLIQGAGIRDDYESIFWSSVLQRVAKRSPREAVALMESLKPFEKGRAYWALANSIPSIDFDLAVELAVKAPVEHQSTWIDRILQEEEAWVHIADFKPWMKGKGFNDGAIDKGIADLLSSEQLFRGNKSLDEVLAWIRKNSARPDWEVHLSTVNLFERYDTAEGKIREWISNHPDSLAKELIVSKEIGRMAMGRAMSDSERFKHLRYLFLQLHTRKALESSASFVRMIARSETPEYEEKIENLVEEFGVQKGESGK